MAKLFTVTENDVKKAVLDYLSIIDCILVERQNVGAVRVDNRFIRFSKAGASDLRGVIGPQGTLLLIELKRPGKKPTPEQEAYLTEYASYGACAFWCDSAEMCSRMLRLQFQLKGFDWNPNWSLD